MSIPHIPSFGHLMLQIGNIKQQGSFNILDIFNLKMHLKFFSAEWDFQAIAFQLEYQNINQMFP